MAALAHHYNVNSVDTASPVNETIDFSSLVTTVR